MDVDLVVRYDEEGKVRQLQWECGWDGQYGSVSLSDLNEAAAIHFHGIAPEKLRITIDSDSKVIMFAE